MSATTKELGELHKLVAENLAAAIRGGNEDTKLLAAAITFLKNNGVVAREDDGEVEALRQALLSRRREQRGMSMQDLEAASTEFEKNHGLGSDL